MAITYEQLQSWKPGDLEAAAEELNAAVRKKLVDQQDEMDAGKPPGTWEGLSAEAARMRHDKLTEGLNDMAAPVAEVINILDQVAPQVKSAKAAAKSAYEAITGKGYKVEVATSATVATSPPPETDEDVSKEEVESIKRQVEEFQRDLLDALQKAEGADADLTAVLTSATKNQFDGGTGSIQQAGLPPELRGLSDEEIVQKMVANPKTYDGYVNALTPEQQAALGHAIGERGNDIRNDTDGIETDQIEDFTTLLEAYGEDSEVSTGFLNEVGPKGLLELNARAALEGDGEGDEAYATAMRDLQQGLGATLAAGTHNIGNHDPGSLSHVSDDWQQDLLTAGKKEIELGDGATIRGFQALAPLLSEGKAYDPEFLSSTGEAMLDYERNWDWEEDRDGPWRSGGFGSTARLDYTDGWGPKDTLGRDPITGLLRGLEDNPEASRQFFSDSATDKDGKGTNLDYLLYEREDENRWIPDGEHPSHNSPLTGIDSLGGALEAATIGDGADERSVRIVEDLVNSSYDRYADADSKFSSTNYVPAELREEFAGITSKYMGSMHTAFGTDTGVGDATKDYLFDNARFDSPDQAARFWLAELGKDPDAANQLRAGSNLWMTDQVTRELHGIDDPGKLRDDITPEVKANYAALGAIDFGASTEIYMGQVEADGAHNKRVDLGVGVVGAILGETSVGKVPGSGFLLDQALGQVKEGLHQDHTGATNREAANLYDSSSETVESLVRDAYWHNLPPDAFPPPDENGEKIGPSTNLSNLTPGQADIYARWLQDNDWGRKLDTELSTMRSDHSASLNEAKHKLESY
ncbi:hypothetical protein ACIO3S_27185 [Nocardioides sp. NPDC087217]|uniref:hypothetical protein n=1 Tax=Nocardioides sp. NPDC087217 TaxID=3364335 RepID=UPI0038012886